jgi:hypothetical protein
MAGKLDFAVDFALPNGSVKGKRRPNWQKAAGAVSLSCPSGCTIGDGKTKLKCELKKKRSQAMLGDGIEFGTVTLDKLAAKVEVGKGRLEVTKFETASKDGQLHVDYAMELEPVLDDSKVEGCLRFAGSQSLLKRDAKTYTAISATGASMGPDNLYHITLTGTFKRLRKLGKFCGPTVRDKNMDDPGGTGKPARPNLTVQPDAAVPTPAKADAAPAKPTFNPPPADAAGSAAADAGVNVPVPGPEGEEEVEGEGEEAAAGSGAAGPDGVSVEAEHAPPDETR